VTKVPIDRIGKIVAGAELGRYVKVADDKESAGGFLIPTADNLEFRNGNGHDGWVKDETSLKRYFQEAGWLIEWIK
jgi:hypothetical protein